MNKEQIKSKIKSLLKEYYNLAFKNQQTVGAPVSGKSFDEKELISVMEATLDGWWTEGKFTSKFEKKFCDYLGIKNTIVVNSGSSANLLAVKALCSRKLGERRIKPGDEIITTATGFPTTINPIIQSSCIPVFCDIDIPTYNIKIEHLEKAISKKTKAVILAHTLGNPFNIDSVTKICKENNLWLIEDNCDALGSRYGEKLTGTFGDLSTFSFYPAHHITMAEGGAVCTNNNVLAKICKSIRDWGRDCYCRTGRDNSCGKRFSQKKGQLPFGYDHKYIYSEVGYNLKNTDLNAAIGIPQLNKLENFIRIRKRNFSLLYSQLSEFGEYFILPEPTRNSDPSWFGFIVTIKEKAGLKRNEFLDYLSKKDINTRLLFAGNITKQPYFIDNEIKYRIASNLTNTDTVMKGSFWLGISQITTEEAIDYSVKSIRDYLKSHSGSANK